MQFRIADTFTTNLARLNGEAQKSAKTTAFDLQINPVNPGMSFHKWDQAKDKNFWSVRVDLGRFASKSTKWMCFPPTVAKSAVAVPTISRR
jgi:hypothetical protein